MDTYIGNIKVLEITITNNIYKNILKRILILIYYDIILYISSRFGFYLYYVGKTEH